MVALASWIESEESAAADPFSYPEKTDIPTKNRVGDFFENAPDRVGEEPSQVVDRVGFLIVVVYDPRLAPSLARSEQLSPIGLKEIGVVFARDKTTSKDDLNSYAQGLIDEANAILSENGVDDVRFVNAGFKKKLAKIKTATGKHGEYYVVGAENALAKYLAKLPGNDQVGVLLSRMDIGMKLLQMPVEGFAAPTADGMSRGIFINVDLGKGNVLAHEVGHLLLGRGHSQYAKDTIMHGEGRKLPRGYAEALREF